jgi:hypothetical protein
MNPISQHTRRKSLCGIGNHDGTLGGGLSRDPAGDGVVEGGDLGLVGADGDGDYEIDLVKFVRLGGESND